MRWVRVSDYCKRYGAHTVCLVVVNGVNRYEVWHGKEFVRAYKDAGRATAAVEREAA